MKTTQTFMIRKIQGTFFLDPSAGGEYIPLDQAMRDAEQSGPESGGHAGSRNFLVSVLEGMLRAKGDGAMIPHDRWLAALDAYRQFFGTEPAELHRDLVRAAVIHYGGCVRDLVPLAFMLGSPGDNVYKGIANALCAMFPREVAELLLGKMILARYENGFSVKV